MKWTYIIRQKMKVALLLGCVMLLVGFTAIMQQRNIKDLSESYSSMYYDRLIPATDIFYLTEHLYNKRLLMEELLYTESGPAPKIMVQQLKIHNDSIASLIARFEGTYLVKDESQCLKNFKSRVLHYNGVESDILHAFTHVSVDEARRLYEKDGERDLQQTIQLLGQLTRIQSTVGLDLFNDSHGIVSTHDMVLTIQIAISIVIGVLIQGLVLSSRMIDRQDQHFNLN
ncbi:MAG TPA: MCP four helix bundle domain-containing protein [Ohtaekwangia sp.]|nr:MCP four helix bundle domain-containing protein [Ohtaekwangia sp.]